MNYSNELKNTHIRTCEYKLCETRAVVKFILVGKGKAKLIVNLSIATVL